MVSRTLLIALLGLGLAACASDPVRAPDEQPSVPAVVEKTPAAVAPATSEPGLRTASAGLLEQAREARRRGDLQRADALLQRAQRLDPANALVYLELARMHQQRGEMGAARAAAERGLLYCDAGSCEDLRELARP
jgi:Flp pilus assembly protein TadD